MDRSLKITLAVLVFLAGTSFALLYRRPAFDRLAPQVGNAGQLVLRGPRWDLPPKPKGVLRLSPPAGSSPAGRFSANRKAASLPPKSTVLTPIDTGQPPPMLAKVFPRHENPGDCGWGSVFGHRLPVSEHGVSPRQATRKIVATHKIVDGDTLDALAKRYLGDSSRGIEIYEANRNLLLSPIALPIGTELVIPQGGPPIRHPQGLLPDKPLVPVAAASK